MDKFKVTFYPDKKTVEVEGGKTILSAALSARIHLNSSCGGDGVCGKCRVILRKGHVIAQPTSAISLKDRGRGVYLACMTFVNDNLEIEIPPESRLDVGPLSGTEAASGSKGRGFESEEVDIADPDAGADTFTRSPLASKLYVELPPPDLQDKVSDLERLCRQIRRAREIPMLQTGLANIRQLGTLLRAAQWKVTVTLGNRNGATEIVLIEPGDTSGRNYGLCFDIGTTTISGQLIDLHTGVVVGTKASYNKQASFGSDVITRIVHAGKRDGLVELNAAVTEGINGMIREFLDEHKIDLNDITSVVCAGNTTMIHLLLGIDPAHIRKEPYVATANFIPTIRATEAGINTINPRGLMSCVPGVSSYVGGDMTAGILSCGLYKQKDLSILIDIGTNGEITLGNQEFLVAAAASAGPAFEGSGVACGMRASVGAIQKVKIIPGELNVGYDTIGGAKPKGICGSGYIDAIAELLRAGVLDKSGSITAPLSERVREKEHEKEFVLAFKKDADATSDIVITESDIENIKRAKAAIYSAVSILVKHMNFSFADIKKVFIAGGFGTYLNMENAVSIGLLPDIEREKFVFIGNSSLAGTRRVLLSSEAMKKAEDIARMVTYFELSVDPAYMEEYMAALFFPHTDLHTFPNVKGRS